MSIKIKRFSNIIVSTHDSIAPIQGGGGLRTFKVAFEFKKRGCNIIIIAPADRTKEIDGIRIHWLYPPRKQRSQILSSIKFNIRLFKKIVPFIKTADIVFVHNTIAAAIVPFLKKIFKFRFFLDITDIHAEYLLVGKRSILEKVLTPFILKYEYFIIKSADFITVATKAMKELLISKGISRSKIEVVYDGVDRENVASLKYRDAEYGIIHLGAIDRQHGVEVLIQAIPYVLAEIPKAKFYFVGGGRELDNMKKLAMRLNVIRYCIFTNVVSQDKAREFLKRSIIGIIPRKDTLPNRIITTLKIYEYWASKTAVLSTALQGIKEVARNNENVLWFQSGNVKELGEKIILLFKDKSLREKLIQGGITAVDKFNIRVSASKIVDFVLKY